MVSVLKSGSNQFHGAYEGAYEGRRFQGNNLTPLLRSQGITASAPLKDYYEVGGDLGGRIIKDKLWFYVSTDQQQRIGNLLGFVNASGQLADYQNTLTDHAVKISYQAR